MARKNEPKEVEEGKMEDVSAPKVEAPKADKDSVTVTWPGGSRVYSKEMHGKDFQALAKEFASKDDKRKVN